MKQVIITLVQEPHQRNSINHKEYTCEKVNFQDFPWGVRIVFPERVLWIPWSQIRTVEEPIK